MNKALFAVFLMGIGTVAAQTPTPADQARQIELQKECLCLSAARSAPVKIIWYPTLRPRRPIKIIGWPTLTPAEPIRVIPTLKKMENK